MTSTERPMRAEATAALRKQVEEHGLRPRILDLLDEMDRKREKGQQVPEGTTATILRAVQTDLSRVFSTDVGRYRDPEERAEQDLRLKEIMPDIRAVARSISFKWPSVVAEGDVVQLLAVHFLERAGSLEKLVAMPTGQRRASLTRVGHQLASEERTSLEVFSGQFAYSVDEVRKLLEKGALDSLSELVGFDTSVQDLLAALEDLRLKNEEHANLLESRYLDGVKPAHGTAEHKKLTRAVDNLALHMNRVNRTARYEYNNGGRRRAKAVANVVAARIGAFQYDGASGDFDDGGQFEWSPSTDEGQI